MRGKAAQLSCGAGDVAKEEEDQQRDRVIRQPSGLAERTVAARSLR